MTHTGFSREGGEIKMEIAFSTEKQKHLQYMKALLTSRALSTTSAFNGLAVELLLVLTTFFASEDDMLS